jgi:Fe-S cluster biogenesis protein NfuA/nitrite reductase/ring-hydroxylating ferredoxin subunit
VCATERIRGALADALLALHDLHPETVLERVTRALETVRPYFASHGGDVELVEVAGGVARVRLSGTCGSCASSTVTLKLAVEDAVLRAAPELHGVDNVGAQSPAIGGIPLPMAPAAPGRALADGLLADAGAAAASWADAGELPAIAAPFGLVRRNVEGAALLFASVAGETYAYADRCPGCRMAFEQPRLAGVELRCGGCGRRYDVRRAGQCLDTTLLQLDPVPLLVEGPGRVKVAVGAVLA